MSNLQPERDGGGTLNKSIWPIQSQLVQHVKASTNISSVWQAIKICVQNSIDANSSEIHVDLDIDHFSFKVTDNGNGIRKTDIPLLCSWNFTSSPTGKGQGIASICNVSVVEISSRSTGSFETYSSIFSNGHLVQHKLAQEQRNRSGTVVNIQDLLYNRPVARKIVSSQLKKEFSQCKSIIERLALLHTNCTFTLFNRCTKVFALKLLKGRDQDTYIRAFFGQQSNEHIALIENTNSQNVAHVNGDDVYATTTNRALNNSLYNNTNIISNYATTNIATNNITTDTNNKGNIAIPTAPISKGHSFKITGWTVRPPHGSPTPYRQLIYFNGRLVTSPEISTMITEVYSTIYQFNIKLEGRDPKELLSVKKARNMHAMYIINISSCKETTSLAVEYSNNNDNNNNNNNGRNKAEDRNVFIVFDPEGDIIHSSNLNELVHAVRHALLSAWKPSLRISMLSSIENTEKKEESIVPTTHMSAPCSSSGMKRKKEYMETRSSRGVEHVPLHLSKSTLKINNSSINDATQATTANNNGTSHRQNISLWHRRRHAFAVHPDTVTNTAPALKQRPSFTTTIENEGSKSALTQILSAWKNPAMMPPSAFNDIHTTSSFTPAANTTSTTNTTNTRSNSSSSNMPTATTIITLDQLEASVFSKLRPHTLHRSHLQASTALSQIDNKFIAMLCNNNTILALIDQHAADERVILERLRNKYLSVIASTPLAEPVQQSYLQGGADYSSAAVGNTIQNSGHSNNHTTTTTTNNNNNICCIPSMALSIPQCMRLGEDEKPLLDMYGALASRWGWKWIPINSNNSNASANTNAYGIADVVVTHVPLIENRALTATDLRLYLHQLLETGNSLVPPAGVTRILNSRACRSALMFGDELVAVECQRLVDALKETQLCFICAHGRPTIVPLVDLTMLRKALKAMDARKKNMKNGEHGKDLKTMKSRLMHALKKSS